MEEESNHPFFASFCNVYLIIPDVSIVKVRFLTSMLIDDVKSLIPSQENIKRKHGPIYIAQGDIVSPKKTFGQLSNDGKDLFIICYFYDNNKPSEENESDIRQYKLLSNHDQFKENVRNSTQK